LIGIVGVDGFKGLVNIQAGFVYWEVSISRKQNSNKTVTKFSTTMCGLEKPSTHDYCPPILILNPISIHYNNKQIAFISHPIFLIFTIDNKIFYTKY
jgi:hypothetical protein